MELVLKNITTKGRICAFFDLEMTETKTPDSLIVSCRGQKVTVLAKYFPHIDLFASVATTCKDSEKNSEKDSEPLFIDHRAKHLHDILDGLGDGESFVDGIGKGCPDHLKKLVKYLGVNCSFFENYLISCKEQIIKAVQYQSGFHVNIHVPELNLFPYSKFPESLVKAVFTDGKTTRGSIAQMWKDGAQWKCSVCR